MLKALVLSLVILLEVSISQAGPLTFEQLLLARGDGATKLLGYPTIEKWCALQPSGIDFGTFAAARAVESLDDGIYLCKGEFVAEAGGLRVQIFSIQGCAARTVDELSKNCKP